MKLSTISAILIIFIAQLCLAEANEISWSRAMTDQRTKLSPADLDSPQKRFEAFKPLWQSHPIQFDWFIQDGGNDYWKYFIASDHEVAEIQQKIQTKVLNEIQTDAFKSKGPWLFRYKNACQARRDKRLQVIKNQASKIAFVKHHRLGGSHYAYTEAQSDAQSERNFHPGSSLCILEFDGINSKVTTIIEDADGVIRDPDVSADGQRILFSWKKSDLQDDYHLYEYNVPTGQTRQLTDGLGFADYEGIYLPNGDIIFNSTRCVQIVDCWWTEVSNLYTCDKDGKFLRRLSFDQVHTNFPTVMDDGKVIYTRWDYNDRGQLYPQPLFQMNPDGTAQTEFYGNNSWFPTTIAHARGIPGTQKVIGIMTGHHTNQRGKLGIIDTSKGRQEADGVTLIAPVRKTEAARIDQYGQHGEQFQYPYPLNEREFLVTYTPIPQTTQRHWLLPYGLYYMDIDGNRELLAYDSKVSCNHAVPLTTRNKPHIIPSQVDYTKKEGMYFIQDIYQGPGLKGIKRGTIKKLRVIAIDYRAAGVGNNGNRGEAGGALVSTPIAIDNGAWDVKTVLGDAEVYADGSASFSVPARTPVYFQAIDANGHAVQTMRSWSTLQPGEMFSCVGCHEDKNGTPPPGMGKAIATRKGPQKLEPFYGPTRGFSFAKEIQPILDQNCIRCHTGEKKKPFSLLNTAVVDTKAKRQWSQSYVNLTRNGQPNSIVNWHNVQSAPSMLKPYLAGAAKSEIIKMFAKGKSHKKVKLSKEELDKLACWIDLLVPYCGDYTEANAWNKAEIEKYQHFLNKRKYMEEIEKSNIQKYLKEQKTTPIS
ncbi:MAG: hypothetical protein JEZ07_16915 [Phycisphaerae bacterium]|nr:hypothetical protein [Phycisphaerae bacterium]